MAGVRDVVTLGCCFAQGTLKFDFAVCAAEIGMRCCVWCFDLGTMVSLFVVLGPHIVARLALVVAVALNCLKQFALFYCSVYAT